MRGPALGPPLLRLRQEGSNANVATYALSGQDLQTSWVGSGIAQDKRRRLIPIVKAGKNAKYAALTKIELQALGCKPLDPYPLTPAVGVRQVHGECCCRQVSAQ